RPARAARTSTSPTSASASTDGGSTRCPRFGYGYRQRSRPAAVGQQPPGDPVQPRQAVRRHVGTPPPGDDEHLLGQFGGTVAVESPAPAVVHDLAVVGVVDGGEPVFAALVHTLTCVGTRPL